MAGRGPAAFNTQVQERLGETFTQAFDTTELRTSWHYATVRKPGSGPPTWMSWSLKPDAKPNAPSPTPVAPATGYDLAQMLGRERTFDGSLQREVASWIDAASWRALLETVMPAAPELQLGGIGERYRRNLSARISELAGR